MEGFLPDGGTALYFKMVSLPMSVILTTEAISNQPLSEYYPGKTLTSYPINGLKFSFAVPRTPAQMRSHFKSKALLALSNFRAGRLETASTGEEFRSVDCVVTYS